MATINGIYVFVEEETLNRGVDVSSHAVEQGIDITDNVRRNPYSISLSGKIVGEDSALNQTKLAGYMNEGIFVNYSGRNHMENALITSFSTSHPNTIYGGCSFTMTIQEVKIASPSSVAAQKSLLLGKTQKGGIQQKIQGLYSNLGGKAVYHTVKAGDTVWALVAAANAPYRSYGSTVAMVMENNPKAFGKANDARTLKIGAKLLIGYEKNGTKLNLVDGLKQVSDIIKTREDAIKAMQEAENQLKS